jgi:hypothetical protein
LTQGKIESKSGPSGPPLRHDGAVSQAVTSSRVFFIQKNTLMQLTNALALAAVAATCAIAKPAEYSGSTTYDGTKVGGTASGSQSGTVSGTATSGTVKDFNFAGNAAGYVGDYKATASGAIAQGNLDYKIDADGNIIAAGKGALFSI